MNQNYILDLIQTVITERTDLFVVKCQISPTQDIHIEIDGDNSASIEDCIKISRCVEHQLDRETQDFSLTVTTPDISKPFVLPRQYKKNLGRILQITTLKGKIEGKLIDFDDQAITLEYKTRIPKEIGKGKTTIVKQDIINIDDIQKAKVKIVFNS